MPWQADSYYQSMSMKEKGSIKRKRSIWITDQQHPGNKSFTWYIELNHCETILAPTSGIHCCLKHKLQPVTKLRADGREQLTLPGSTSRALSQSGGWAEASSAASGSETGTSRPGTRSWGTPCGYRSSWDDGKREREKGVGTMQSKLKTYIMFCCYINVQNNI